MTRCRHVSFFVIFGVDVAAFIVIFKDCFIFGQISNKKGRFLQNFVQSFTKFWKQFPDEMKWFVLDQFWKFLFHFAQKLRNFAGLCVKFWKVGTFIRLMRWRTLPTLKMFPSMKASCHYASQRALNHYQGIILSRDMHTNVFLAPKCPNMVIRPQTPKNWKF